MNPAAATSRAFRDLARALLRRRLAALDPRLGVELTAIGALVAGFVFWRVRLPLDHAARTHAYGAWPLAAELLAACALAGAALAGARHHAQLTRGAPGPAWRTLPVPARDVARHLAHEAGLAAWLAALPSAAVLVACVGLMPAWTIAALGVFAALAIAATAAVATWLAQRLAVRVAPLELLLARGARAARVPRHAPPAWRARAPWRVLLAKDARLAAREPRVRDRVRAAAAAAALGGAAWLIPGHPPVSLVLGFGLALAAGVIASEALVDLSACDPYPVLRALPVTGRSVWRARVALAGIAAGAIGALQAPAAWAMGPANFARHAGTTGGAALLVTVLGATYGVTLFPRHDVAARVLAFTLALCVAASIMMPLAGWLVLLTALIHGLRRLPRFGEAAC